MRLKRLFLGCVWMLAGCYSLCAADFPTEHELPLHLRKGMTTREVRAAFGAPAGVVEGRRDQFQYHYIPSLYLLTGEHEGYVGFTVHFEHERVVSWSPMLGNPSYEPPHVPPEVKWIGKFYLVFAIAVFFIVGLARRVWAHAGGVALVRAFNAREIATAQIPAEFRFITEETTLQEVIDRLGEPTSLQPLSVNPRQIRASQLIVGADGGPAIVVAEYELPNGAAVALVPEYPFELDNRIRTAVYRKAFPDVEET